jgi:hypothetical protein
MRKFTGRVAISNDTARLSRIRPTKKTCPKNGFYRKGAIRRQPSDPSRLPR